MVNMCIKPTTFYHLICKVGCWEFAPYVYQKDTKHFCGKSNLQKKRSQILTTGNFSFDKINHFLILVHEKHQDNGIYISLLTTFLLEISVALKLFLISKSFFAAASWIVLVYVSCLILQKFNQASRRRRKYFWPKSNPSVWMNELKAMRRYFAQIVTICNYMHLVMYYF